MATFPSIEPSYGLQKQSSPTIKIVKYADGFEQRQLVGIAAHQNKKYITLHGIILQKQIVILLNIF